MPKMPKKDEPRLIAVSRYDRDDYDACRALPPAENDMEPTYDEWLQYNEPVIARLKAEGHHVEFVDVRSHELGQWLKDKDLPNSPQSRAHYVHEMISARYATKQ